MSELLPRVRPYAKGPTAWVHVCPGADSVRGGGANRQVNAQVRTRSDAIRALMNALTGVSMSCPWTGGTSLGMRSTSSLARRASLSPGIWGWRQRARRRFHLRDSCRINLEKQLRTEPSTSITMTLSTAVEGVCVLSNCLEKADGDADLTRGFR